MNKIYQKTFPGGKTVGFTLIELLLNKRHSRGMLSGISRFLSCGFCLINGEKKGDPEQRHLRMTTLFNKKAGDPRQKHSGMTALTPFSMTAFNKCKRTTSYGFTLIELLVVVLIIGVLAAIALPQYQMAVYKSRLTRLLPIMQSIKQANQLFYLANGYYTNDISQWDISLPEGTRVDLSEEGKAAIIALPDGTWFSTVSAALPGRAEPRVQGFAPNVPAGVLVFYNLNKWLCYPSGTAAGRRLCQALGCTAQDVESGGGCVFSF